MATTVRDGLGLDLGPIFIAAAVKGALNVHISLLRILRFAT
jgi:hypothetical protein